MDEDLPQASRITQIRDGDSESIDILTSLFMVSIISLVDLYDGTVSALFCAVLFLATRRPNPMPGSDLMHKAEEFSRVKMAIEFLADLHRLRKCYNPVEDDSVSRHNCGSISDNQLVLSSHQDHEKPMAFSRWKTVSTLFEFLYKIRKFCKDAKDSTVPSSRAPITDNWQKGRYTEGAQDEVYHHGIGMRMDNQLMIFSHGEDKRLKVFKRWRSISLLLKFLYKTRKFCEETKKNNAVSLLRQPNTMDQQNVEHLGSGATGAVDVAFRGHHHGRRDNQPMIHQENKRHKAVSRWRIISLLFKFLYKTRKCCEETKKNCTVALLRQEHLGHGVLDSKDIAFAQGKQLALSSHGEKESIKEFNRWRTISLLFEFLYKIRKCCNETKRDDHDRVSPCSPLIIETWQKGKYLGGGAFGSVYEAYADKSFFFALKEVPLDTEDRQHHEKISHAEQEISVLSRFQHRNIVRYLGSQKDDSKFYIFLELVAQGSLAQLYKTYHLSDYQASGYTKDILRGLSYLHTQNVIHRDIKCANVLVEAGSAKLADFGLAKVTKLNDIKSSKGSPYWMAPEVVNPKKHGSYGIAADIWSLGCTVLEMLTRKIPYSDLEPVQALFKIAQGRPPPIPNTLSTDARDFILKCLQVNPVDRPTAAQLLNHPFVNNYNNIPHSTATAATSTTTADTATAIRL